MFIYHSCKFVCRIQWILRPGITLTMSLIVLIFLNLVRQRKGPKMRPCCGHQQEYTCTLPRPPEVYRKPLKCGYFWIWARSDGLNSVHFWGAVLCTCNLHSPTNMGELCNTSSLTHIVNSIRDSPPTYCLTNNVHRERCASLSVLSKLVSGSSLEGVPC